MPDRSARSTTRRGSTERTDRSGIGSRLGRTAASVRRVITGSAGTCTCTTPLTDELAGALVFGGATFDGEDADDGQAVCWRCGLMTGSPE